MSNSSSDKDAAPSQEPGPPSHSTPPIHRESAASTFSSAGFILADDRNRHNAADMKGQVSIVPVQEIFDRFFPGRKVTQQTPNRSIKFRPQDVDSEANWTHTVNRSGVAGTLVFMDTKDHTTVTNGLKARPDITAFAEGTTTEDLDEGSLAIAELVIERKGAREDPFGDPNSPDAEKDSDKANLVRGQLISYAKNLHSMRPRLFSFQLLLLGKNARILRWDHTGVVVSESFDWWSDSNTLALFLQRFNSMTPTKRGLDPSVRLPTKEEIKSARAAFLKAGYSNSPASQLPFYVYSVPDDIHSETCQKREFLAGRPIAWSRSFTGRASTGYVCYELGVGSVYFMKDAWRHFSESGEVAEVTEKSIYLLLNQELPDNDPNKNPDDGEGYYFKDNDRPTARSLCSPQTCALSEPPSGAFAVPHVPTLICGGDISQLGSLGDQVTFNHQKLTKYRDGVKKKKKSMQTYTHFRLILKEVGKPLSEFASVPDLLQVLEDIVNAHRYARKRNVLHRDISAANVMIVESSTGKPRGLLVDWDLAVVNGEKNTSRWITGTWQFMSIGLLDYEEFSHSTKDDLESVFWLLLFMISHYTDLFPETWDQKSISQTLTACFDWAQDAGEQQAGERRIRKGGTGKLKVLRELAENPQSDFSPPDLHTALELLLKQMSQLIFTYRDVRARMRHISSLENEISELNLQLIDPQLAHRHRFLTAQLTKKMKHKSQVDQAYVQSIAKATTLPPPEESAVDGGTEFVPFCYESVLLALKLARNTLESEGLVEPDPEMLMTGLKKMKDRSATAPDPKGV
ncbi:hypothetical protein DL93DRAFT_2211944 [Clavulina sp. PMI_390]|nr:hypothetical protein DL93DRAFT_2211944 [Clavulina sp. PMI_390]